jgi:Protein of unknown function (DUF2934)
MRKTLLIRYVCEAYSQSQVHAPASAATPPTIVLAKREPLTEEVMVMAKSAQQKTDDLVAVASDRAPKVRIDAATDISEHDIARRAYDLYLTRGSEPGHDVEDWLQAERELRSRSGASTV